MLTKRARVVLDTMIPAASHPQLTLGIFDAGFDKWYADFRAHAVFSMKIGFWAALFVAVWIAPLLIRRIPPISLYDRATRERALEALAKSDVYLLRQMLLLIKATICFCYGANREVRDALGVPRPDETPNTARG